MPKSIKDTSEPTFYTEEFIPIGSLKKRPWLSPYNDYLGAGAYEYLDSYGSTYFNEFSPTDSSYHRLSPFAYTETEVRYKLPILETSEGSNSEYGWRPFPFLFTTVTPGPETQIRIVGGFSSLIGSNGLFSFFPYVSDTVLAPTSRTTYYNYENTNRLFSSETTTTWDFEISLRYLSDGQVVDTEYLKYGAVVSDQAFYEYETIITPKSTEFRLDNMFIAREVSTYYDSNFTVSKTPEFEQLASRYREDPLAKYNIPETMGIYIQYHYQGNDNYVDLITGYTPATFFDQSLLPDGVPLPPPTPESGFYFETEFKYSGGNDKTVQSVTHTETTIIGDGSIIAPITTTDIMTFDLDKKTSSYLVTFEENVGSDDYSILTREIPLFA